MTFDGPLLDNRWRLGPRMGSGAQAKTFLARDERAKGERIVVLKQFALDKSEGWKNFDLFEREVRVLEKLRHPHIPRYIDSFESKPGEFNLVIEKKPGATLRAMATKVRFADHELRDITARVLEILDHIHRNEPPIIHRDIKPANLLRDAKGKISLVDFGGVRDALRLSGGSTIVGTFGYMAPEQLHGQATPATDIYGLGATIVALAGKVEPEDVPRKGLRMDLQTHLADRDPALVGVLQSMTQPDPDERPQSAREVIELLAKAKPKSPLKKAQHQHAQSLARIDRENKRGNQLTRRDRADDVADDDRRALARVKRGMAIRQPFDEVGEIIQDVPSPFSYLVRILLFSFALSGYLGIAVTQAVFLPIVFVLVGAFTSDKHNAKIAATRADIDQALSDGRSGFGSLAKHCLASSDDDDGDDSGNKKNKKRKRLPRPERER